MNYYKLLDVLSLSATLLVANGSEISRVNQTIKFIANTYGIEDVGVFITPTGLMISFDHNQTTFSRIKMVEAAGYDIDKINRINAISRNCSQYSIDEVFHQLEDIKATPGYPNHIKIIASGGIALCFTFYFGGELLGALFAFGIGCSMQAIKMYVESRGYNSMLKTIFLSAYFTLLPLLLVQVNILKDADPVITGCLMLMVPGLALIASIRDAIAGDTLSGMVRMFEAVLISVGIVIGTTAILTFWSTLLSRGIL